jgi:hypothetical protein
MARKLKGPETQQHRQAFEIYYGLGGSRSLQAVAREVGVSETAVRGWSRTFGWTARVEKRDTEVAEQVNKKAVRMAASRKIEYLDIINKGMKQFEEGLDSGTIKVRSVADAERLINMYIKLLGESQVNQTNVTIITASDIIKAERKVREGGGTIDIDISEYAIDGQQPGPNRSEDTTAVEDADTEDNTVD